MNKHHRATATSPLAIIGVGLRLPGEIHSLDALREFLMAGGDAIRDLPPGRWAQDFFDPTRTRPGTTYVRRAGYVDGLDLLDARFFGMSAHEASRIDPQQRMLLETGFEALEMAGLPLEQIAGTRIGVFVGLSSNDYMHLQTQDPKTANAYTNTGAASSIAANRISYAFDLNGPSMSVDTACSSGLTALHLAARALAAGDCDAAIVGAANALLTPEFFVHFCAASMLSPVGQCRAFDRDGAGFVRAEGAVAYVLKPLDAALAAGDPVLGVVHASACNNDGTTAGIAMPSSSAQAALLQQIYGPGGVDVDDLVYVEAHGTGTAAGDPQEATALGTVIGQARKGRPLPIGSVKTNLGHLEPAAGLVGIAKALVALQGRVVPPQIHFDAPNPGIDFAGLGLRVVDTPLPLPPGDGIRIGVNSFGFGGSNAHVVIGPAPARTVAAATAAARPRQLFLLSAESEAALSARARDLAAHVAANPVDMAGLSGTLLTRRSRHRHAVAFHAGERSQLLHSLEAIARGESRDDSVAGTSVTATAPAFVFTGNGPQWFGMGQELMRSDRLFRETVEEISAHFERIAGLDLVAEMGRDAATSRMAHTDVAQPALFALQIALVRCLAREGVRPAAVVGHSAGELAAAHVAGVHDLPTIARIVAARSTEQERTVGEGAMAALGRSREAASVLLQDEPGLVIAGENAAEAVTVAGDSAAIDRVVARVTAQGHFARRLDLAYAFHSPVLDRIETGFRDRIRAVDGLRSAIPMYSSVTAGLLQGDGCDADYWWRNLRAPVLFRGAIEAMIGDGHRLFVEVGPHPALSGYLTTMLRGGGSSGRAVETLRRGRPEVPAMERAVAQVAVAGAPLDLSDRFPQPVIPLPLPAYPWQRERHFHAPHEPGRVPSGHALLGDRLGVSGTVFSRRLTRTVAPFLADHVVRGSVLFPAAGFFELALAAARQMEPDAAVEMRHLRLDKALRLDAGSAVELQTQIDRPAQRVAISSRADTADGSAPPFETHVSATLMFRPQRARHVDLDALRARIGAPTPAPSFYAATEARGLSYGPAFRTVTAVAVRDAELLVCVERQGDGAGDWHLDPTLMDGALQALISFADAAGVDGLFLPVALGRMVVHGASAGQSELWVHVVRTGGNRAYLSADITLALPDGTMVAELQGMEVRRVGGGAVTARHLMEHRLVPLRRWSARLPCIEPASLLTPRMLARFDDCSAVADRLLATCETLRRGFVAAGVFGIAGGDWFRVPDLVAQGRLSAQHARYTEAMLADAARSGRVVFQDGRYRIRDGQPQWNRWSEAVTDLPGELPDLLAMARIGEALTDILAGRITAQEVLFPGAGSTLMEQLYESGFGSGPYNAMAADVLTGLMSRLPSGRLLRVLEIGAGTGGTTAHVLPVLPEASSEYVFTDVSAAFFPQAERRFGGFPAFKTRTLDISVPPDLVDLGGVFDVVIAANALHATPDLARTLRHVRECLAPGGLLVLLETAPSAQFTYQFGLLTGFWAFNDPDLRSETCVLNATRWREALQQAGFDATAAATVTSTTGHEVGSALLARNPEGASQAAPWAALPRHRVRVVCDGEPCARSDALARAFDTTALVVGSAALDEALNAAEAPQEMVYVAATGGRDAPIGCDVGWPLVSLVQKLAATGRAEPPLLTVVTSGVLAGNANLAGTAAWAVARTVANEYESLACRRIDVTPDAIAQATAWLLEGGHRSTAFEAVDEVLVTTEAVFSLLLEDLPPEAIQPPRAVDATTEWCLSLLNQGSIDNARVRALPPNDPPQAHEVEIRIEAAGLNFRDVILALGLLPPNMMQDSPAGLRMGLEAAGVVTRAGASSGFAPGERVMTISGGCFASSMVTPAYTVRRMPADWSFEDAATVPVVGLTVVHALGRLAALQPGETLLVHGGAGGIGLTAIRYAQSIGAKVIATAGAPEKRSLLHGLGVDVIADSRSLAFADDVLMATDGQGVDVVLNSLAGEAMHASVGLLKRFGRFVEIGKRDFEGNSSLNLAMLAQNVSYFAVDLAWLLLQRPDLLEQAWTALEEAVRRGAIAPLSRRTFPMRRAREALRHLQAGHNMGKVVLTSERSGLTLTPRPPSRQVLSPDGAYLVTGGLGGLGLRVAAWLVARGARRIVLIGRSGATSTEQWAALDALRASGAQVDIELADVSDPDAVQSLVERVRARHGAIRGLIHSVLTLSDSLITGLTRTEFERVTAAKVQGALAFDRLLRNDVLDHFVCFSSIANVFGNPGQANYVAANGVLEALMAARRQAGQPGLALGLGPVSDAGFVARNADVWNFEYSGVGHIVADDVMTALDALLSSDKTLVALAPITGRSSLPLARSARMEPVFRSVRVPRDASSQDRRIDLTQLPEEERLGAVEDVLVHALAQVTGLSETRIDRERSFAAAGLDSLMAVEMGMIVEEALGVTVSLAELGKERSIRDHATRLMGRLGVAVEGASQAARTSPAAGPLRPFDTAAASSTRTRLYAIHDVMGLADRFAGLAELLANDVTLIGIEARGLERGAEPHANHADMVAAYADAIAADANGRAVCLLGWSYGGIISNDVACRLRSQGLNVTGLVVLDAVQDSEPSVREDGFHGSEDLRRWGQNGLTGVVEGLLAEATGTLSAQDIVATVRAGTPLDTVLDRILGPSHGKQDELRRRMRLGLSNVQIMASRVCRDTFDGPVLLFRATDTRAIVRDPAFGWGGGPSLQVVDLPCRHLELLDSKVTPLIAQAVSGFMARLCVQQDA